MLNLTLLDAVAILYFLYLVARAGSRTLGESLHGLITLSLIIALLMGLRLNSNMRGLLTDLSSFLQGIPGLGSKLLIVLLAWYLMRLLRKRLAYWIESAIPKPAHKPLTRVTEGLRAIALVALLVWLAEGWFARSGPDVPLLVHGVRWTDAWVANQVNPLPQPPASRPFS